MVGSLNFEVRSPFSFWDQGQFCPLGIDVWAQFTKSYQFL